MRYSRDDVRKILGYDIEEIGAATKAYVSELVEAHAPQYRMKRISIKINTLRTYMSVTPRDKACALTIGMQNVLGHCEYGLQEYKSIRSKVHLYDASGFSKIGGSLHYTRLRCWNAVILHEFTHMLNYAHETGKNHDKGFVKVYNELLAQHMSVENSILGILIKHDNQRRNNSTCDIFRAVCHTRAATLQEKWSNYET